LSGGHRLYLSLGFASAARDEWRASIANDNATFIQARRFTEYALAILRAPWPAK